jgi:cytochrome bd-type quinol oxidase subunit 2
MESSNGLIPWWILPLLAVMFLFLAFEIKNGVKRDWFYYTSYFYYPLLISYIVLLHKQSIGDVVYLWLTMGTIVLYFILMAISHFSRK